MNELTELHINTVTERRAPTLVRLSVSRSIHSSAAYLDGGISPTRLQFSALVPNDGVMFVSSDELCPFFNFVWR